MLFTIYPEHSKKRVKRAGDAIRLTGPSKGDVTVIENWRASHNYILNTFQATLRRHAKGKEIIVAQRLKRRNTIYDKLSREPKMNLARMHDIAGCRLIFENSAELDKARGRILKSRFKHKRKNAVDDYNYINHPKDSGYRGIHDVYEYVSFAGKAENYNGLLIELQYRTRIQHAWATAVEIFGSVTGNEAKFERASTEQQYYFKICSELLARNYENRYVPVIKMDDDELINTFKNLEDRLGTLKLLEGIHKSATQLKNAKNLILISNADGSLNVEGYRNSGTAILRYFKLEDENKDLDIVLVRSDNNEGVRSAFKNYFKDTQDFTNLIRNVIKN